MATWASHAAPRVGGRRASGVGRRASDVGRRRAEEVVGLLRGAGLAVAAELDWIDGLEEADGIDDWETRHVTVVLMA